MAENPNFFVGVVCDAFLPAHRDKSQDTELTPEEQARARAAYKLLSGMKRVPGRREDHQIDEETLLQWIYAVREKAGEAQRAVVADVQIGQLLAHSPKDPEDNA